MASSNSQRIPGYELLRIRPSRQLPAALLEQEHEPPFRKRVDELAHPPFGGGHPASRRRAAVSDVRAIRNCQGFGESAERWVRPRSVYVAAASSRLRARAAARADVGSLDILPDRLDEPGVRAPTLVKHIVLDRCARCSTFTATEAASIDSPDRAITWWAIAKAGQRARLELYLDYAKAASQSGDLDLAREVALEIVGHVALEDPRPHMLLGQLGVRLGDQGLFKDARGFLQFLQLTHWDHELVQQARAHGLKITEASVGDAPQGIEAAGSPGGHGRGGSGVDPPHDADAETRTSSSADVGRQAARHRNPVDETGFTEGDLIENAFRVKHIRRGGMGVVYVVELEAAGQRLPARLSFLEALTDEPAGDYGRDSCGATGLRSRCCVQGHYPICSMFSSSSASASSGPR